MAPSFGVSWLCVLLCSCICFPPLKGYNTANDYYLYESPRTSDQYYSGIPSKPNYLNEQARRQQSFVPFQEEPGFYGNHGDDPGTEPRREMLQSQPSPGHAFSTASSPPAQTYESPNGYYHPFGLLLKRNIPEPAKGVSFPTIDHLQRFIQAMKTSYLTPGSDTSRHFQTARETMKNVDGESSRGYMPHFANQGSVNDGNREAEFVSGSGENYNNLNERPSLANPVGSTASFIPSNVFDNPEFSPGSAPHPHHSAAGTGRVVSNLAYGGHPGANAGVFSRAPENPYVQTGQTHFPSGSFFGEEDSYRSHVAAPPTYSSYRPPQDSSFYASDTPLRTPVNLKYTARDPTLAYQTPSGGNDIGENSYGIFPSVDAPPLKPVSLNHHSRSLYAPSNLLFTPSNLPKQSRPLMAAGSYQPTTDKEPKDRNYSPTIYQPENGGYAPLNSNHFAPQRSEAGFRMGNKHRPQKQAHNKKQPNRSNLLSVKPPTSLRGSSRPGGYSGYQKVNPRSISAARERTGERSDPYNSDLASAAQRPKEIPAARSPQRTSYGAGNPQRSYSRAQRRSVSPNDGYGGTRPELQRTFKQPPKVQVSPAALKRQTRNTAYWQSDLKSAPKGCFVWTNEGNTNGPPSKDSTPSMNALFKSRNRLARATAHRSKLCYTPHQEALKKTAMDGWKHALRQQVSKNQAFN